MYGNIIYIMSAIGGSELPVPPALRTARVAAQEEQLFFRKLADCRHDLPFLTPTIRSIRQPVNLANTTETESVRLFRSLAAGLLERSTDRAWGSGDGNTGRTTATHAFAIAAGGFHCQMDWLSKSSPRGSATPV
jgi:hypothetical protein